MNRQQYIDTYKGLIEASTSGTGLFPSVMMAQAILESGDGNTQLAYYFNNHFGIKASGSWQGRKVNMQTREVVSGQNVSEGDYFRVYPTAADSFVDRNRFLLSNGNYAKAGVFSAKTPEEQAAALQKAGYATDPNYSNVLVSLIRQYNLTSLDAEYKRKRLLRIGLTSLGIGLAAAGYFFLSNVTIKIPLYPVKN